MSSQIKIYLYGKGQVYHNNIIIFIFSLNSTCILFNNGNLFLSFPFVQS